MSRPVFGIFSGFAARRGLQAAALLAVSSACSSPPPVQAPVARSTPSASAKEPENAELLRRLLVALPPAGALLGALPPDALAELERQRGALSPEQRELLLEGTDPVVATRPLLYAAVGGADLSITSLSFSSSAGSSEIVGLLGDRPEYPGLVTASNELARRAALHTLRARAVDVAPGVQRKVEHLKQIALAARLLERTDIERLALVELLAQSERVGSAAAAKGTLAPAEWHIALAQLEARALEPALAREHLARASVLIAGPNGAKGGAMPALGAGDLVAAEAGARALISAAELVVRASTTQPALDERVAAARAALTLGLDQRAVELLTPYKAEFGKHLAYSTTWARALTRGNACPEVWPTLVTERLCRQAWAEALPRVSSAELDKAWESGQGRDAWAVETYLGFSYVVPMMYGLERTGSSANVEGLSAAFAGLRKVAQQAQTVDEDFKSVALLARALSAAVLVAAANPGQPTAIAKDERTALLAEAVQLARPDAKPWARAAALAVAAILTQHEATGAVLEPLREADLGAAKVPLGGLLLWDILADGDVARFERLRPYFGELAVALDASAFARSTWLFEWAEAEAHLRPGQGSYTTLDRIAVNLSSSGVPLELRLRAVIDRAGLLARNGDFAGAAALLEPVVSQTPRGLVSTHSEQELLVVATGYLIVVRGLQATGAERADYAKKLQAFLLDVTRASAAPPTLQMWLLMWGAEFEALIQRDACRGRVACERKIDSKRGADLGKLSDALGARVAGLLARGVLPVGGVKVEFRYQPSGHLEPDIDVSSAFLLAHVPAVANNVKR
jgi:hypothetical protein